MPLFEYRCKKCGGAFEHLARRADDVPSRCPSCGAPRPERQLSVFSAAAPTPAGAPPCASGACGGAAAGGCAGSCPYAGG